MPFSLTVKVCAVSYTPTWHHGHRSGRHRPRPGAACVHAAVISAEHAGSGLRPLPKIVHQAQHTIQDLKHVRSCWIAELHILTLGCSLRLMLARAGYLQPWCSSFFGHHCTNTAPSDSAFCDPVQPGGTRSRIIMHGLHEDQGRSLSLPTTATVGLVLMGSSMLM